MSKRHESASEVAGSEQWVESFAEEDFDDARNAVQDSVEQVQRLDPANM